ncbi:unnamed protein product [Pleuronectes platessa]|uniref:Uncharacterized protein n=1 Tax=Pleuronectes platessa TaxID=8262 RepID=A0A9N7TIB6_PLEPL|nr:unnamed protein product [Pleuronectes platessa]
MGGARLPEKSHTDTGRTCNLHTKNDVIPLRSKTNPLLFGQADAAATEKPAPPSLSGHDYSLDFRNIRATRACNTVKVTPGASALGISAYATRWRGFRVRCEPGTSVTEEEVEKLYEDTVDDASTQNTEEEMQEISEQSDSTIALLQESKMREISQVFKIKLKKRKKLRPAQTKPQVDGDAV